MDLSEINYPRVLHGDCSDRFGEVKSTLNISTHFEETCDVSTTYMGKLCPTGRNFEFESQIFVSGNGPSQGALMDETSMRVLFDKVPAKVTCPSLLCGQYQSPYPPEMFYYQ